MKQPIKARDLSKNVNPAPNDARNKPKYVFFFRIQPSVKWQEGYSMPGTYFENILRWLIMGENAVTSQDISSGLGVVGGKGVRPEHSF